MSETTDTFTTSYGAFIPEVWSQKLNTMLEKDCVMLQCVNRNYEGEIKNQGDKVKIITPAEVSISTLGSSNITYDALEPTATSLVIDQKKFFAFKIALVLFAKSISVPLKIRSNFSRNFPLLSDLSKSNL